MKFQRFMREDDFLRELASLKAFRCEYHGTGLLESLEATGLLRPHTRIRYPDAIARRFWGEVRDRSPVCLKLPQEADEERWSAAVELDNALHRWNNYRAYGLSPHPLDDPDPRFVEFIQDPTSSPFERRHDRRVDVSNDLHQTLFADCNIEDYFSSWQVLFAAEVSEAGIHFRIDLADESTARAANEAINEGRIPEGSSCRFNFVPVHAVRAFGKHKKALDAVVWFSEERGRELSGICCRHSGGRFCLDAQESTLYEQRSQVLAGASVERFCVDGGDLVASIRFLAEYWSEWDRDGRPLVAGAYKEFLGQAVLLARRVEGLTFLELRDRVGVVGGRFKPILDVIWPDWTENEEDRARLTLRASVGAENSIDPAVTDADIDTFVNFLAVNGLEAFFWRLNSFESHALRGNEFAVEGMKSDVQGMAIAVEHVAEALGGTKTQLFEKFKQLWRRPEIQEIIMRGNVAPLARTANLAEDWPALKARINALRDEPGGYIAADLVMAHRIRGSVHSALPEGDHFALEELFIGLMRAALHTFLEVRRNGGIRR